MATPPDIVRPKSPTELHGVLVRIQKNWGYVKEVALTEDSRYVLVDLGFRANAAGHRDFKVPVKPSTGPAVKRQHSALRAKMKRKQPITRHDAALLFSSLQRR